MLSPSNASFNFGSEDRKQVMKRNQKLCLQIMKVSRANEVSMATVSHREFEGISIDEFVEHCKLLDEGGFVEAQLIFGGVAHIRLTARGQDLLDSLNEPQFPQRGKLGFL